MKGDAKENLLTAIEIAAAQDEDGDAIVPEVTVYFEDSLFRANRTTKRNAEHFSAFNSYNYPALAKAGVHITYQPHLVHYNDSRARLKLHTKYDPNVAVLKLFPGIGQPVVHALLHTKGLRAVVLETFGAGNAPTDRWLYRELKAAVDRGIIILPDDYSGPAINSSHDSWSNNSIIATNWTTYEAAGAVFLPASGQRYGTDIDQFNFAGYYWSSTDVSSNLAFYLCFDDFGTNISHGEDSRYIGCSVRLVRDAN